MYLTVNIRENDKKLGENTKKLKNVNGVEPVPKPVCV